MHHNNKGFTLVELLVGLAISSIIIAAAYGSYIVIKNNYDFQKDMKNISQSSRAVATMIMRDVRMAGYNFDDGPTKQNPVITNPLKITDGGTTGPDSIEIIYDQSFTQRLKISYYSKPYPNTTSQRSRLYKKVERCDPSVNCGAGSLTTIIPESPIADYVEDIQFTGLKNGNALSTGAVKYGEGNLRWVSPTSIKSNCEDSITNVGGGSGNVTLSGAARYAFDGNPRTTYSCSKSNSNSRTPNGFHSDAGWINLKFATPVRLTKIQTGTIPNIDGGSGNAPDLNSLRSNFGSFTEPYGKYRPLFFELSLMYGRPGQQCVNTCADSQVAGNSCTSRHWSGGKKCLLQSTKRYENINVVGPNISFTTDLRNETNSGIDKQAITELDVYVSNSEVCKYDGGTCVDRTHSNGYQEIPELLFFGEVYGEAQNAQEVEIGLLIRSPAEHGNTPKAQSWNIGNRTINTNDGYLRDVYTISALVRNVFYGG